MQIGQKSFRKRKRDISKNEKKLTKFAIDMNKKNSKIKLILIKEGFYMERKNSIISAIIITVTIALVMAVNFTNVGIFAADSKILNVIGNREGDETYKITNLDPQKTIWKIVSYDSMEDTAVPNYNEAIYCLTPEQGFGSETSTAPGKKQYDVSFDMKDLSKIDEKYLQLFGDTTNDETFNTSYNSLLWIIDNMYLPKQLPENQKEIAREILYKKAGIEDSKLTDNDIEVVQQLALWYFTSTNEKYHFEPENFPSIAINDTAIEEIGKPLTSEGIQRYEDMKLLYTYFVTSAKENASSYGTENTRNLATPVVKVTNPTSTNLTLHTIEGVEYSIAGPYTFTETTGTKLPYILEGKVLNQINAPIEEYKLLDENKQILGDTKVTENLLGKEFYIAIPKANTDVTEIKLEIEVKYFKTKATVWTNASNYATEQLVVVVEREPKKEFDLALRKFITKVNEEEITTRYPEVSLGEDGKLIYTHSKDPILVANNDIVIYTIRVYNEGKVDGYAKEVTDDIPLGLNYLPEHEINKKYNWKLSEDGKKVSTNYLSKEASDERKEDNLIKAFDATKPITEEDGNRNPDYREIQIAFKVTEKNLNTDRIIINTAEITDDSDKDGNDIIDEDSTPNNGVEDEDDIDKEYLQVKYFDLSLLKWVSKVYLTEDGKTTVTETGHTGLEQPEPIVKVDLDRKKIDKVVVKFGYKIKITNEGQIAGYATEISDYIPDGLKFVKEDNPDWEEIDGKIITTKLANTLLQPGESATVEVILTWVNDSENMGVKVNVAEISKDDNENNAEDIDSTPNNQKEGEDDIDDAPVMLAVKTGSEPIYIELATIILAMLGTGIYLIKKYVLD